MKPKNKRELQRKSIELLYQFKSNETRRRIRSTKNCMTAIQSVELLLKENMRGPLPNTIHHRNNSPKIILAYLLDFLPIDVHT